LLFQRGTSLAGCRGPVPQHLGSPNPELCAARGKA
jgi:hypothetical protein